MNPDEFAEAVKEFIHDRTAPSLEKHLLNPPGRSPGKDLLEMSGWFSTLNENDRSMVLRLCEDSSHSALFGLFCALDGVRKIADLPEAAGFRLVYFDDDREVVLADSEACTDLHDAFQAAVGVGKADN